MIAMLLVSDADAGRVREALVRDAPVVRCQRVAELERAARTAQLVLTEPLDVDGIPVAATVSRLRVVTPHLPIIAYTRLTAESVRALVGLAESVLHALIISGVDDSPRALRKVIDEATARSCEGHVWDALLQSIPKEVHPVLRYCIEHSAVPLGVADVARALGMAERTMNSHLRRAALPGAQELIGWCRLVRVACLLSDRTLTLEAIAHRLDFPSASALHVLVRRLLGISPRDLRRIGATTRLIAALWERLLGDSHRKATVATDSD